MNKIHFIRCKAICFLLLTLTIYSTHAQPAWSRGIQILSVTHEEGMQRAKRALETEGYTIQNQGGDFIGGQKKMHSAVITCNATADGRAYINIFVASISSDANVPGEERIRLQTQMDRPGQKINNQEGTSNIAGRWIGNNGFEYDISQTGSDFTYNAVNRIEKGEGKIAGKNMSLKWSGNSGSGTATGLITQVDVNGRATRIEWNIGVVWTRN